jgi:hypothetical protein
MHLVWKRNSYIHKFIELSIQKNRKVIKVFAFKPFPVIIQHLPDPGITAFIYCVAKKLLIRATYHAIDKA